MDKRQVQQGADRAGERIQLFRAQERPSGAHESDKDKGSGAESESPCATFDHHTHEHMHHYSGLQTDQDDRYKFWNKAALIIIHYEMYELFENIITHAHVHIISITHAYVHVISS